MQATPWLTSIVLSAASLAAQSPATKMIQAQIVAAKLTGSAVMETKDGKVVLKNGDEVVRGATVTTGEKSSVVLVFSNGTVASLAASSSLVVSQFLQDPYAAGIDVAKLTEEPTASITKLQFLRGEVVISVKKLRYPEGSEFHLETPAGVAAPRGTVILARLTPKSADTAIVRLEVHEGVLAFSPKSGPYRMIVPGQPYEATVSWTP